jgi:hypothetical protein
MFTVLRFVIVFLSLLYFPLNLLAQPQSGQALVEWVRDAHRAARESIRTLSCDVEVTLNTSGVTGTTPESSKTTGQYWRSMADVRVKASSLGEEQDVCVKSGVLKAALRPKSGTLMKAAIGPPHKAPVTDCDVWPLGLLALNRPGTLNYFPFEQLLEMAADSPKASRRTLDGREFVVVELSFDAPQDGPGPWNVEIYFDPTVNYLIRKTFYRTTAGAKARVEREDKVLDFIEGAEAVFVPIRSEFKSYWGKKLKTVREVVLSAVRVNQLVPPGTFDLRFPAGALLLDHTRKVYYTTDPEGNPTSKPEPLVPAVPPPPDSVKVGGTELVGGAAEPRSETREEVSPLSRWVLLGAVCALFLGVALALQRRWRKTAD